MIDDYYEEEENREEEPEGLESSIYKKKKYYKLMDLFLFYEGSRFTAPFIVYRSMKYWPLFDKMAKWGHVVYSGIIVSLALFKSISVFMCFQLVCVCAYYMLAIYRLAARARFNRNRACLRGQCDIRTASLITKNFNRESFYEFLSLRRTLWHIQFTVFIIATCIGYPTELLYKLGKKPDIDPTTK